jgi:hypothetical protein
VFKSGFVQKLRSRLFWPRRRNTRRSNYAPLSAQTSGSGGNYNSSRLEQQASSDDFDDFMINDEFNTVKEHQPNSPNKKKRSSMLPSMNFSFGRKGVRKNRMVGGSGGLDDRYREQAGRQSGKWSGFLDAIGMNTPRETAGNRGYANVDFEFEGEF